MASIVYKKEYTEPIIDEREALRYAGVKGDAQMLESLLADCVSEARGVLSYKVSYRAIDISEAASLLGVAYGDSNRGGITSRLFLERCRDSCEVIVFTATIGIGIDRLIRRYSELTPSRALMLNSLGSERVEALCDLFCEEISLEKNALGYEVLPRFSPGYGDLPLELQRRIIHLTDATRNIGVSLNDSLLMSPSKSVTAIMGVKQR